MELSRVLFCGALAAALLGSPAASAGAWGVSPILLDFDPRAKTGSLTVSNDDPAPLTFQVKLMSWTQDAEGRDQYADSEDLVFFPRIMTIQPGQSRIIRVGTKSAPPKTERAYRLFVEEIPAPDDAKAQGAQIAVKLRFGVPVFVAPVQPAVAGSIEQARLARGELQLTVSNTGNQRFRFETLTVKSAAASLGEAQGWYLLAGARREYRIELDPVACRKAGKVTAALSADGLELKRELDVIPAQCQP